MNFFTSFVNLWMPYTQKSFAYCYRYYKTMLISSDTKIAIMTVDKSKMSQIRRTFPLLLAFFTGLVINTLWIMDSSCSNCVSLPIEEQTAVTETNPLDHPYPTQLLPEDDYYKLINITNFNFTIMNQPCKDNLEVLLLVVVHTAAPHKENRETIRNTWGQKIPEAEVLFMLGAVASAEVQEEINKENEQFKDLIQGNFEDDYRNMTYKHVMALKYAAYHCPQAKYVLKTDDDVFVNMPKVISYVQVQLIPIKADNFMLCKIIKHAKVFRKDNKWAVNLDEYSGKEYPTYCAGWSIIYSSDVVFKLYLNAQKTPYFWIDDVHVTGTLAVATNITHESFSCITLAESRMKEIIDLKDKQKVLDFFLFGPMQMSISNVKDLWNALYGT